MDTVREFDMEKVTSPTILLLESLKLHLSKTLKCLKSYNFNQIN